MPSPVVAAEQRHVAVADQLVATEEADARAGEVEVGLGHVEVDVGHKAVVAEDDVRAVRTVEGVVVGAAEDDVADRLRRRSRRRRCRRRRCPRPRPPRMTSLAPWPRIKSLPSSPKMRSTPSASAASRVGGTGEVGGPGLAEVGAAQVAVAENDVVLRCRRRSCRHRCRRRSRRSRRRPRSRRCRRRRRRGRRPRRRTARRCRHCQGSCPSHPARAR